MDVEFIYTRDTGQRVFVVGRVKMREACRCNGDLHPHASDFFLDSAVDIDTDERVTLEGKEVLDIEDEAIELAYEDVSA